MKVALLAPDDNIFLTATRVLKDAHSDITLTKGLLSQGVEVAKQLIAGGCEVIITRGQTAELIKRSGLDASIVEVAITGFDLIRAVNNALKYGRRIAVVAFQPMYLWHTRLVPFSALNCKNMSFKMNLKLKPLLTVR